MGSIVESGVHLWEALEEMPPRVKKWFVLGLLSAFAFGFGAATWFWERSFTRQIEMLKLDNQVQRSIGELNGRIRSQDCEEPVKQKERPSTVPTPRVRPNADAPSERTPPQLPGDAEKARVALRYVEGAQEYFRRGEEVRAIEAYVSAAKALPKTFLSGELFPEVDLNDREARSKLLAAFQNIFSETTLERLHEMTKGN
jgi:hypothetical protein